MRSTAAFVIFFTATTLASPAPKPLADPSLEVLTNALSFAPEVDALAAAFHEVRDPTSGSSGGGKIGSKSSGSKTGSKTGSSGSKSGDDSDSAAAMLTSNVVLELGALGLGVLLWI
ncbi:hypothetical protein PMIN06_007543 [Paraphaeosphaeria minitans]